MITIYRVNIISLLSFTHLLGRFVVGDELLVWLNMLQYTEYFDLKDLHKFRYNLQQQGLCCSV